jgi:hypothetical protein
LVVGSASWFAGRLEYANTQHAAVAAIKESGGDVLYDWQVALPSWLGNSADVPAPWLRQFFENDFVATVAYVRLLGPDHADALFDNAITRLATLTDVRTVCIGGACLTDGHMAKLGGLSRLESVYLDHSAVTEAGMRHLGKLGALRELRIVQSPVTSGSSRTARSPILDLWLLPQIKELRNLRTLCLGSMGVTDRDLTSIKHLGALRELDLRLNPITDAGMVDIEQLARLETLSLDRCLVTDRGLARLVGLKTLMNLRLGGDGITDASIVSLREMASLRHLSVTYCKFSQNGYERLKRALPNCSMFHKFYDFAPSSGSSRTGEAFY